MSYSISTPIHYSTAVPTDGVMDSTFHGYRCSTRGGIRHLTREPRRVTCQLCRRYAKLDVENADTKTDTMRETIRGGRCWIDGVELTVLHAQHHYDASPWGIDK